MGDLWLTDLGSFLDENGEIVSTPADTRALAEYFTAIVLMASYPDHEAPAEYAVRCRRRPGRRPCPGEIVGFVDPETDEIVWMCPKCDDRGMISNWRETMWDSSGAHITH